MLHDNQNGQDSPGVGPAGSKGVVEAPDHPPRQAVATMPFFRRAHRSKPDAPLSIGTDNAALDDNCRRTLRRLLAAGCMRANEVYSLEQFQVAEAELHHLKRYGLVNAQASALLHPVLQTYQVQRAGADVGKITVILNVDLR